MTAQDTVGSAGGAGRRPGLAAARVGASEPRRLQREQPSTSTRARTTLVRIGDTINYTVSRHNVRMAASRVRGVEHHRALQLPGPTASRARRQTIGVGRDLPRGDGDAHVRAVPVHRRRRTPASRRSWREIRSRTACCTTGPDNSAVEHRQDARHDRRKPGSRRQGRLDQGRPGAAGRHLHVPVTNAATRCPADRRSTT